MENLDFYQLVGDGVSCESINRLKPDGIPHKQVADVVAAFIENAHRLIMSILTPASLVHKSRTFQRHIDAACLEVGGSLDPIGREDPRYAKFQEYMDVQAQTCTTWHLTDLADKKGSDQPTIIGLLVDALAADDEVRCGLHSLLTSFVTGTWTAVEVLAGDLWEAALNVHPTGLASLGGKHPGKAKPAKKPFSAFPPIQDGDQSFGKLVKLDYLRAYGYDLSGRMGTVLRERFSFQTVDGIRDAYVQAFDETYPKVREAILHPSLIALAACRNLLAHRAGVVDADFMADWKRCQRLQEVFPEPVEEKPLPITGGIVGELIFPALEQSAQLIEAVVAVVNDIEEAK